MICQVKLLCHYLDLIIFEVIYNILTTVSAINSGAQILIFFVYNDFLAIVENVMSQDKVRTAFDFAFGLYQLHFLDVKVFVIFQLHYITKAVAPMSFSQVYFYGQRMATFFRK